ncbi:TetR-like C-terminal domain-containing protein [Nocardioides sp. QY071]|uniref:TetR-like C-terminal domain-containing protein n=1 Tax=Nocardioides sp. QY071 TaxID=3044187 RepID=UPI00249A5544|nr:TetR-like C-terminal domain-containing protein [Nocardioides sp. QY071]WGY00337.1 TetR-like C-terminal domain-containing protein [Nocardioides sp. QY071]
MHEAVLALIAEGGSESLSMKEISARSGVHEATLYRRWRDVDTVILDAATTRVVHDNPIQDTGSLRGDLRAWAAYAAAEIAHPAGFALFEALIRAKLISDDDDADATRRRERARAYLEHRSAHLQEAIDRARERGEPAPPLSAVLDGVLAPLYLRAVFGYRRTDEDVEMLIDRVLSDHS